MSRLARRLARMERGAESSGRIFFTSMEELPEAEHTAFLAAERERLGIGAGDIHFVTVYEAKPCET